MTRRAPRRPPPTAQFAAVHCRALVLVDGTAIRNKIKKDYEKARRDLATAQQQLDQFHQTDVPQFTQWLNTNFGALLTELRELSQKLAADADFVFRVENEVFFNGTTHARAYKRVLAERENSEPAPPPNGEDTANGKGDPFDEPPGFDADENAEDPLEALFNQIFGEFEPGEPGRQKRSREAADHQKGPAPRDPSARVKELYRALVRRLHPDAQQEMTAQKKEWWHQAQDAYEAGDADQLEVILTLWEIGESGTTKHTSPSLLQRITGQLKSSLREIKRQIAQRRKDPAWGFSGRADREAIFRQVRRDLQGDLDEMRDRWQEIQHTIAGWKASAERIKPRRSRRASEQSMEFPF